MAILDGSGPCAICTGTDVHCATKRRRKRLPLFHEECAEQAYAWTHFGFEEWACLYPAGLSGLAPTCYLCGEAPTYVVEHVLPRSRGGADEWSNVGGACNRCNLRKSNRILDFTAEQKERFAVQQASFRRAYERALKTPDALLVADATAGSWLDGFDDSDPEMTDGAAPWIAHGAMLELVSNLAHWEVAAWNRAGGIPAQRGLRAVALDAAPLVAEADGLDGLVFPAALDIAIDEGEHIPFDATGAQTAWLKRAFSADPT